MYNRYIASINPRVGDIQDIQNRIDALVVKEIGRSISTLEDVFSFLKNTEDKKLFDLAIFNREDLIKNDFNLAVFIVTFEIIGDEKEHLRFFYKELPAVIFCILYERRYRVSIVTINDMHEFQFCFDKVDKKEVIDEFLDVRNRFLDFFENKT